MRDIQYTFGLRKNQIHYASMHTKQRISSNTLLNTSNTHLLGPIPHLVCPIGYSQTSRTHMNFNQQESVCWKECQYCQYSSIYYGSHLLLNFALQANRDVTRMEIFMSLVRLLDQTMKGGASSSNAIDNNMMLYHSFPQATQIPATGRPSSLQ